MNSRNRLFLEALMASVQNRKVQWDFEMQMRDWIGLFRTADVHHVLPMIYEAVYDCPAAQKADLELFEKFKKRTIHDVTLQTIKTGEFLSLYRSLYDAGLKPLVVKGIICRNLYPKPDYRMSADEDIWIMPEQFQQCHEVMQNCGMKLVESKQDVDSAYEVSYIKVGSPILIELHKSLFPPESDAYGDLNEFFESAHERAFQITVDGMDIYTMNPTDHLLYLICHSFKHFLHSGFGIRQVCDIMLFANKYGSQIDWQYIRESCRLIHAESFTAALFKIGAKYLAFDPVQAHFPDEWLNMKVDEKPMLADLLDGGIYGASNMSRKHSSNITLNAITAQKKGKKSGNNVLRTIFPPVKSLEGHRPYLKKHPYLLPVAWAERILKYRKEVNSMPENDAAESIKIGNQRIELMKQYGIIK